MEESDRESSLSDSYDDVRRSVKRSSRLAKCVRTLLQITTKFNQLVDEIFADGYHPQREELTKDVVNLKLQFTNVEVEINKKLGFGNPASKSNSLSDGESSDGINYDENTSSNEAATLQHDVPEDFMETIFSEDEPKNVLGSTRKKRKSKTIKVKFHSFFYH